MDEEGRPRAWLTEDHLNAVSSFIWSFVGSALEMPPNNVNHQPPHLFMVLGNQLQYFPMWALPIPSGGCLLDRFAPCILPSAGALVALARRSAHPLRLREYHGFAPFDGDGLGGDQIMAEANRYGGVAVLGMAASLERLRHSRGVVSIATHSDSDMQSALNSMLLLRGSDGTTQAVTAAELALALQPSSSPLMCLWSCAVHGAFRIDDSWMGLTGAVLTAATSLVATLWPVSDVGATAVATRFWPGLERGLSVPQALRNALRQVRDADRQTVIDWGDEISSRLPTARRDEFTRRWTRGIAALDGDRPLEAFRHWAGYCSIGWPVAISTTDPA
jgi:hypothetical protein